MERIVYPSLWWSRLPFPLLWSFHRADMWARETEAPKHTRTWPLPMPALPPTPTSSWLLHGLPQCLLHDAANYPPPSRILLPLLRAATTTGQVLMSSSIPHQVRVRQIRWGDGSDMVSCSPSPDSVRSQGGSSVRAKGVAWVAACHYGSPHHHHVRTPTAACMVGEWLGMCRTCAWRAARALMRRSRVAEWARGCGERSGARAAVACSSL